MPESEDQVKATSADSVKPATWKMRRWVLAAFAFLLVAIQFIPYGRRHTNPPVTVAVAWHSRAAESRVLDILEAAGQGRARGVLHCFGGDQKDAARAVEMGMYLGFGGTVTYKRASSLAVALSVDPERVLLETDCPFLAPVPYRGKRNEPAYVNEIATFLAEQTGRSLPEYARQTTSNAEALFRLDPSV